MTVLRIASDWHLAPGSPPRHGRLAEDFLRRAYDDGAEVILNGDVFDDLFAGPGAGQRAHPAVVAALERLAQAGRLRRTAGNHDPAAGAAQLVVEWAGLGRVLVAHGDAADPVNGSPLGRLGEAISARFGRLAIVRGGARLAELTARAVAGRKLVEIFRARCVRLVVAERCDLGVFGHVHVPHLAPGDPYANAGALGERGLHYLELGPAGAAPWVLTEAGARTLPWSAP